MEELVDKYLAYLKGSQGRSANTLMSYRRDLDQAAAFLQAQGVREWSAVDQYQLLALIADQKRRGRSPATINRQLSALRQFTATWSVTSSCGLTPWSWSITSN